MSDTSAAPRLFGTDGMRAPFGEHPLDRPTVTALGAELGRTLAAAGDGPRVVVGGDTRDSTLTLCRWLAAGLQEAGATVTYVDTIPTPGVAWEVRAQAARAGIAVSASHNPWPDNGIKLFDADGRKWAPQAEAALEQRLEARLAARGPELAMPELVVDRRGYEAYVGFLTALLPSPHALAGLSVLLDTAHGATYEIAPRVFAAHGAGVRQLAGAPDGRNINQGCGSTHPEALAAAVRTQGADLGIAFDGDGDRAILVDEQGEVRDGDAMLYLWARSLFAAGQLDPPAIVATSMSNLGLEQALRANGVEVVRCDVGDRTVMETMRARGIKLGGEQSGHLVHAPTTSTGDGLVTALTMANLVVRAGRPLSQLLAGFRRFPQILRNVRVREKRPFAQIPAVAAAQAAIEGELAGDGRLVLRYSGTEPLARIMLEGPELATLEEQAARLEGAIRAAVGT
ncbi:MAG TPA: phosphoglucosamine mutase [Thermoanaerobaculia bacterium]|jgi:phosphoglucosamine mutase|nr:phosphoglucosamine mutase [Thermoanaerobaculia bacterium]